MSPIRSHRWPRETVRSRPRPGVEQTRARYPDVEGKVDRDGVAIAYEVYGQGDPTFLLMPTWSLVHSRVWKAQIAYLARHARVVTYDPRGNGRSDRPTGVDAYRDAEYAADALAVLDATRTDRAIVVALSKAIVHALLLAAEHPERVSALVAMGPALPLSRRGALLKAALRATFERRLPAYPTWHTKFNAHYWQRDHADFVESYMRTAFNEPHSTKQIEDAVGWGLETNPDVLLATFRSGFLDIGRREARRLVERVRCPVVVITGDRDRITPVSDSRELARLTGGRLEILPGSGHGPVARNPVPVATILREVAQPDWRRHDRPPPRTSKRKRVLYLSSPIGLGHARRDLAVAKALRGEVGELDVDWVTQDPVTRMLDGQGERIHPASAHLASEVAHIDAEAHDHDLHVFQAWRRMDEILVNNYLVVRDVLRDRHYDLVIGDESWEVDYFLHENPSEKVAPFVWFTDFVGWLPMASGGEHERFLAADYNAEMVEHIDRQPTVRDLSLFVGSPEDVVTDPLGPGLPSIREWTTRHFEFPGYITGFDPATLEDREALRAELGYRSDEAICVVTVGGSGVGSALLRRIIDAYPEAERAIPGLRMVVVAGPRIDPASLPRHAGVDVRGYVPDLPRHLAACDIAIIQGGLTTAMELVASRRPFLYFPLKDHFEQQVHVPHRLARYRAGRRMDIETASPDVIATALAEELQRHVDYLPVEADGAARAARLIANLL